jgi:hypothetical protein
MPWRPRSSLLSIVPDVGGKQPRCPSTGFDIQHESDNDPDVSENEYEAVTCLACTKIHLVNRKTGKVLGQQAVERFSVKLG